uniref:CSON012670 protein n=1 Tax=Culicoides sonorensis TaxID=179676 RepID=A0A336MBE4_CULSO
MEKCIIAYDNCQCTRHVDLFLCCVVELKAARLIDSLDKKSNVLSISSSRTFMIPSTSRPTKRTINALIISFSKYGGKI